MYWTALLEFNRCWIPLYMVLHLCNSMVLTILPNKMLHQQGRRGFLAQDGANSLFSSFPVRCWCRQVLTPINLGPKEKPLLLLVHGPTDTDANTSPPRKNLCPPPPPHLTYVSLCPLLLSHISWVNLAKKKKRRKRREMARLPPSSSSPD